MKNGLIKLNIRRFACLMLTCLSFLLFPGILDNDAEAYAFKGATGLTGDAYDVVGFYKWTRLESRTGLGTNTRATRMPIMIIHGDWRASGADTHTRYVDPWNDSPCNRWAYDGLCNSGDMFIDKNSKTFYTSTDKGCWTFYAPGSYDGDNSNCAMIELYATDGGIIGGNDNTIYDNRDFYYEKRWWGVATGDNSGSYCKGLYCPYSRYFHNAKGGRDDEGLDASGQYFYMSESTKYTYEQFITFTATREWFSAITKNYTVKTGTVFNIDDKIICLDNVTITVEPGAVLSVKGTFFLNGIIKNYGTVILQEGATVCSFDPVGAQSSSIKCYGTDFTYTAQKTEAYGERGEGALLIMKNAKYVPFYSSGCLTLYKGATTINYGLLIMCRSGTIYNSQLITKSGGTTYMGYTMTSGYGSLCDYTNAQVKNNVSKTYINLYRADQVNSVVTESGGTFVGDSSSYGYVNDVNVNKRDQ